jgi:hypothetical protein
LADWSGLIVEPGTASCTTGWIIPHFEFVGAASSYVDGVAHVHEPLVTAVSGLNGRLDEVLDLSEFVEQSNEW